MIKPKFITFTGIDERTDPYRIIDLSSRYPVEWGILFSRANQGKAARYPSLLDVGRFLDRIIGVTPVKLSAHICGAYSREIMEKDQAIEIESLLMGRFSRTQINIRDGETHVMGDIRPDPAFTFAQAIGAEKAIVQCRGKFPNFKAVDWLFDVSGGSGIQPESWDASAIGSEAFCGYAGGIGPKNVTDILTRIAWTHPEEKPFWIDMEGHIRTEDWLDLEKCEAVLSAVYG